MEFLLKIILYPICFLMEGIGWIIGMGVEIIKNIPQAIVEVIIQVAKLMARSWVTNPRSRIVIILLLLLVVLLVLLVLYKIICFIYPYFPDEISLFITGRDREGYDRRGYDKNGYNRRGYDQDGFNSLGINSLGYAKCRAYDTQNNKWVETSKFVAQEEVPSWVYENYLKTMEKEDERIRIAMEKHDSYYSNRKKKRR